MADPHIGPALQLIHERPDQPWTLGDLGHRVGLGRSAFSARFTSLVGQSMYRYLIARRMAEAGRSCSKPAMTGSRGSRPASATRPTTSFSKLFQRHHGLVAPGRYRAVRRAVGGRRQGAVLEAELAD